MPLTPSRALPQPRSARGKAGRYPTLSQASAHGCPVADDRADLVQQVKAANDIVEVVGGYLALRPAGSTFKGLCPFHDDQRPSLDVDPRRQRYKCWACGAFGD